MNKPRAIVASAIGALALLAGAVSPAAAAPGDTVTTFTLGGGTLSIAVQPTAALTNGNAGDVAVTGNLGPVSVADSRGNVLGWTASATSTTFVGGAGSNPTTSTLVVYSAGTITKTGVVPTLGLPAVPLVGVAAPVVTGTVVLGNNTAAWNPTLAVTLPSTSLAGQYTGTVNTSVA